MNFNDCAKFILDKFQHYVNICFLKKYIKSETGKIGWFSDGLKNMRKQVKCLKRIFDHTNRDIDWRAYTSSPAEYRKYSELINDASNKSKMAWYLVNNELNSSNNKSINCVDDNIINPLAYLNNYHKPYLHCLCPILPSGIKAAICNLNNSCCLECI